MQQEPMQLFFFTGSVSSCWTTDRRTKGRKSTLPTCSWRIRAGDASRCLRPGRPRPQRPRAGGDDPRLRRRRRFRRLRHSIRSQHTLEKRRGAIHRRHSRGRGRVRPLEPGSGSTSTDGDGDLDLFVANYFHFRPSDTPLASDPKTGKADYGMPSEFGGKPIFLFKNVGNGRFDDVSASAGITRAEEEGWG